MAHNINVTTAFSELVKYYNAMPDKLLDKIQKEYLKQVARPYASRLSADLIAKFPATGSRPYGVVRTTTGRLSRAASKTKTVHVKKVKNQENRVIAYFYIPKGKEAIRNARGTLKPFPHTYSAWIDHGTRSHTIRKYDIRGANIVSRVDYYKEKIMRLEQKLYSLPAKNVLAISKTREKYEHSLSRYESLLDRLSNAQTQGNAKGIVKGISKRNFIQPVRDKINMQGSKELTSLIMTDLKAYFSNQPSVIGSKQSK